MADDTPLMKLRSAAGDGLLLRSLSARETMSRLFEFQITAYSADPNLAADDLLGTPVAVSVDLGDGTLRWFHGVVAAFGIDGHDGRFHRYRLVARPWLWLLTRSSDIRIFQDQTAPEIIKSVFGEYASHFVDELSASYTERSYCVQYRESDFNFVSRLMEDEGIFYYFRHSQDKHELVLADSASTHVVAAGFESVDYIEGDLELAERQALNRWRMRHEIQTGQVTLGDYHFETPSTSLISTTATTDRRHAEAEHEVYDHPGLHTVKGDGDTRAQLRVDAFASRHTRYTGEGNVPGLVVGARFALAEHPRQDQNTEYIVLSTQIELRQRREESVGYEADGSDDEGRLVHCQVVAQAASDPYRPARTTPRPTVGGLQTAKVVGSGNDGAIHVDEHGRVKVQFHWDRLGSNDENSSCWLRVASQWAGNGWGMISLPRIGQEVVVAFLEGDPDRPLVVGSVHNPEQKPPYALPDHASVSSLKSRSVGGEADAFNELRFEDKDGEEYVLLQAQKDRLEFVEETLRVEVGKEVHRTVKEQQREKIGGALHLEVVEDMLHKVGGKLQQTVTDAMLFKGGDVWSLKTGSDITAQAGAAISLKSSADMHLKIGSNLGADAAQNVHIKGGMNIVIEGGVQISIKAGGSSIVLGPDGVSITGVMVKINSGGSAGSGSGANPVAPTDPAAPEEPELPEDPLAHR
jgi:type VI secretion system secreted protein VgrG